MGGLKSACASLHLILTFRVTPVALSPPVIFFNSGSTLHTMTVPTIAIVGAGPCGLTLARLLEGKGIDYVFYERDTAPECNRTGGSLDIQAKTGQRALRECGLFGRFIQSARYDDTVFAIADHTGQQFLEIGQGRDAPEIDRAELRQLLLDSVPEQKIKWGHVLESATLDNDNRPILRFADGGIMSGFRLVVGADGAWSKIRPVVRQPSPLVTTDKVQVGLYIAQVTQAVPKYTGKSIIVSSIRHDNPAYERIANSVKAGSSLSIGSGKYIMVQRQGDGLYRISFGLQAREQDFGRHGPVDVRDTEATRHLLLSQFFADWSEHHKDIIRRSTSFRAWTLHSLSPEDMSWQSVPGVTLAGDAAHLSYPGGEGVNLAMSDALKLASKLAEHGVDNIGQAVQTYEEDMFSRAIAAMKDSNAMEGVMYSDDPRAFIELICS